MQVAEVFGGLKMVWTEFPTELSTVKIAPLSEVIARPTGSKSIATPEGGVATEVGTPVEIISQTPEKGVTLHVAKATCACDTECLIEIKMGDEIIGWGWANKYNTFIDWYPWGVSLEGDGNTKVSVIATATLTVGTAYGTIFWEETPTES